jgi:hypothetical protein
MDQQSQQTQIQKTLLEELGLANLPKDKQDELLIKMTEVLLKQIFLETMDKLGDQGMKEYDKMVEEGATAEQLEEFFKSKIVNYDTMVQKVIEEFKKEMKKGI